ncbi:hypothetical protein D3C85_1727750 [compost metagenome]
MMDSEPPLTPIRAPAPAITAKVKTAIPVFHMAMAINLANTEYDLGTGLTSMSLIVLLVYSIPNTQAEVNENPTTSKEPMEPSRSAK